MGDNRKSINFLCLGGYLFFVVFITLLSRTPSLTRSVHVVPFWPFFSIESIKQISLNIILFIPLGFFISGIISQRWICFVTGSIIPILIELLQFFSYRGIFDIDDIISNVCGVAIGILIWRLIRRNISYEKLLTVMMLIAGFVGCIFTVSFPSNRNVEAVLIRQFDFGIDSIQENDNYLSISGHCQLYNRSTPEYKIILGNTVANTIIDGDSYVATSRAIRTKTEVQIQFSGYTPMSTGIWINGLTVDYVPEYPVPVPNDVDVKGVLKAYCQDFDTYVYQDSDRLIWLIGCDIGQNTEIVYHLYTNEPENLPENRAKYGFDNRGFYSDSGKKTSLSGRYRIYEDIIPNQYNVTSVTVGYSTDGINKWVQSFRIK